MIKCIVGKKGSGKTKQLIEDVNLAVKEEPGSVICIERGPKLTYDISHRCRLIDVANYPVRGYDSFLGFICGIYAQNYDISHIFIDSLYKIVSSSEPAEIDVFIHKLEDFATSNNVRFTITISDEASNVPGSIKKYM